MKFSKTETGKKLCNYLFVTSSDGMVEIVDKAYELGAEAERIRFKFEIDDWLELQIRKIEEHAPNDYWLGRATSLSSVKFKMNEVLK